MRERYGANPPSASGTPPKWPYTRHPPHLQSSTSGADNSPPTSKPTLTTFPKYQSHSANDPFGAEARSSFLLPHIAHSSAYDTPPLAPAQLIDATYTLTGPSFAMGTSVLLVREKKKQH